MKRLFKLLLALCLCFSLFGCKEKEVVVSQDVIDQFHQLTDQWFIDDMSEDYLSVRFGIKDETKFGLDNVEVTLGEVDYDDPGENTYAQRLKELKKIDPRALDETSRRDYEVYVDYYTLYDELYRFEWDYGFIFTPNSGVNNNLVTNFTELTLRNEKDVQNLIILLNDVKRYMEDCIEYTRRQAEDGIVQSDGTMSDIISQVKKFVEKVDDNEIIKICTARIDELNLVNGEEYKEQVIKAVKESVIPGYQAIIDFYKEIKGKYTSTALSKYEHGKEYYELLFKVKSSGNANVEDMKKALLKGVRTYLNAYSKALNTLTVEEQAAFDDDLYDYGYTDVYEMLEYLKGKMVNDYPAIPNVSYTISLLDPSVASENVSAYYLIAPVDDVSENVIRLNPKFAENDPASTLLTLSHEGYPGHCYEHTYFFANNVNSNLRYNVSYIGSTEGWAMFSELVAYDYLAENDDVSAKYAYINKCYTMFSYYLYGYCDIIVNYDGQTFDEFKKTFSNLGFRASKDLYNTFVGDPLQFIPYSTGLYQMVTLNENFKEALGNDYSLKQFTTIILDQGNSSFPILESKLNEYVASVKTSTN